MAARRLSFAALPMLALASLLTSCANEGQTPALTVPQIDEQTVNTPNIDGLRTTTPEGRFEQTLRIARATVREGDTQAALAMYREIIARYSGEVAPRIEYGRLLAGLDQAERAAGAYRSALSLQPDNPRALRGFAAAQLAMGNPNEAVTTLQRLADNGTPDVADLNNLGIGLDMLGRHADAQNNYRRGLAIDPNDLDLQANLALSYALNGEYGQAISLIDQVVNAPLAGRWERHKQALIMALSGQEQEAERILTVEFQDADFARSELVRFDEIRRAPTSQARARAMGAG